MTGNHWLYLLLHRAICNILLQFNVLRLANNVFIHWCWLLLLLLVSYCQRVTLLAITFLPHSTVVHHSTNQCSSDEWDSTGDNCCDDNIGGIWVLDTLIWMKRKYSRSMHEVQTLVASLLGPESNTSSKLPIMSSKLWTLDSGIHVYSHQVQWE